MIAAVIPVKDEPDIESFVAGVRGYVDRVIVVDDSVNRPLGHVRGAGTLAGSVLKGLQVCNECDRVVTIDAGGSHDPAEIPYLLEQSADVVIGSRFCEGGVHAGPQWRRLGSRMYGRAWQLRTGQSIADWTSGFRVYSRRAVYAVQGPVWARRHAFQAEILNRALQADCTVAEVPITYEVKPGSTFGWPAAREAVGVLVRR